MPAAVTEQTTSISISTTGTLKFGFLNVGFVFSVLGGLQALVVVLGLLVTCLMGASTSFNRNWARTIEGCTFYVIVLLVSFWCLLTSGFLYISCAVSLVTATLMPRTIFFILFNAMAALFYLVSTITCLGEASPWKWTWNEYDVRPMVIAASVLGIGAGAVYVLLTIVGIFSYKRATVSTSSSS